MSICSQKLIIITTKLVEDLGTVNCTTLFFYKRMRKSVMFAQGRWIEFDIVEILHEELQSCKWKKKNKERKEEELNCEAEEKEKIASKWMSLSMLKRWCAVWKWNITHENCHYKAKIGLQFEFPKKLSTILKRNNVCFQQHNKQIWQIQTNCELWSRLFVAPGWQTKTKLRWINKRTAINQRIRVLLRIRRRNEEMKRKE